MSKSSKVLTVIVIIGILFMAGRTVYNAGYRHGVCDAMDQATVSIQDNVVSIEVFGETWEHILE